MRSVSRRLMLIPIAAAALALGACGDDSSTSTDSAQDDRYIQALQVAGIDTGDRGALIADGKQVCDDLKNGKSLPDFIDADGAQGEQVRSLAIAGAAVGAFCPDQHAKLMPSGVPTG